MGPEDYFSPSGERGCRLCCGCLGWFLIENLEMDHRELAPVQGSNPLFWAQLNHRT